MKHLICALGLAVPASLACAQPPLPPGRYVLTVDRLITAAFRKGTFGSKSATLTEGISFIKRFPDLNGKKLVFLYQIDSRGPTPKYLFREELTGSKVGSLSGANGNKIGKLVLTYSGVKKVKL